MHAARGHDLMMLRHHPPAERQRDEGSTLLLVLVLVIIVGLIVVPLMSYAISVNRASAAQSDKSRDVEAAKGGVRRVLADPEQLYDECSTTERSLGGPSLARGVTTTCDVVGTRRVKDTSQVPFHIAAVQADALTPSAYALKPYTNPNTAADHDVWLTNGDYNTVSASGTVWVPDLAVRVASLRPAVPTPMRPGTWNTTRFPAGCDVFFPGTYIDPLTINYNAFFVSGVYYFEQPITFTAGADVVVGDGNYEGCTSDQGAAFDATNVPSPINASGYGATWVLGADARIIVDNSGGSLSVKFNQRYVAIDEDGAKPSEGVSIISVNGNDVNQGDVLGVDGVLEVPHSNVGGPSPSTAAAAGYDASAHNPRPLTESILPVTVDPPEAFQTGSGNGGAIVRWTDPNPSDLATAAGVRITGYEVTATPPAPSGPCIASVGASIQNSCNFADLTLDTTYTFEVETLYAAANVVGMTPPDVVSAPSPTVIPSAASALATQPNAPTSIAATDQYDTGVRIEWSPPGDDGGAPIFGYQVLAAQVDPPNATFSCVAAWDETSCVLDGLPAGDYDLEVVAANRIVDPLTSPGIATITFSPTGTPVPSTPSPSIPLRIPDPIIEFALTGSGQTTVEIDGYISVPQGRIWIEAAPGDPSNSRVRFLGGAVAAQFGPISGTGLLTALPSTFALRLSNPVTQKIILLTSRAGEMTASALVQVNETGSFALNSLQVR